MSDVTNKEIGERIQARREQLGWRQEDLARKVSESRATVSNWERGTREIGLTNAARLLRALNREPNWLLGFDPRPESQKLAAEADLSHAERLDLEELVIAWKTVRRTNRPTRDLLEEIREIDEQEAARRDYSMAAGSGEVKDPLGPRKDPKELLDEARERKKREREE